MTRVVWTNSVGGLPRCNNVRSVPKKPVIWRGSVWLLLPSGERDTRNWKSHNKITREDAQKVLGAVLDSLIAEHGNDTAVDSGYTLECR